MKVQLLLNERNNNMIIPLITYYWHYITIPLYQFGSNKKYFDVRSRFVMAHKFFVFPKTYQFVDLKYRLFGKNVLNPLSILLCTNIKMTKKDLQKRRSLTMQHLRFWKLLNYSKKIYTNWMLQLKLLIRSKIIFSSENFIRQWFGI